MNAPRVVVHPRRGTPAAPSARTPSAVHLLAVVTAVLAGARSCLLLLLHGRGTPVAFVTARGEPVLLTGSGADAYDSVFASAGNLGVAIVTAAVAVLALIAARSAHRGSLRAALLLTGTLGYLLYVATTTALGSAYGTLFLLDVAVLAAALPAFALAVAAVPRGALVSAVGDPSFPRRPLGVFLLVAGAVTLVVWGSPLVAAVLTATAPPELGPSTTMVTDVLDLAVIVPATLTGGVLALRRRPGSLLVAVPLLVLITALLPTIALSTVFQVSAGIHFATAVIIGPIGGFTLLGVGGAWLLSRVLVATPRGHATNARSWSPGEGDRSAGIPACPRRRALDPVVDASTASGNSRATDSPT